MRQDAKQQVGGGRRAAASRNGASIYLILFRNARAVSSASTSRQSCRGEGNYSQLMCYNYEDGYLSPNPLSPEL